jgi:hypothetical protein
MNITKPTPFLDKVPPWVRGVAPILIGALLAVTLLQLAFVGKQTRFSEAALGPQTSSYYGTIGGRLIHCDNPSSEANCFKSWRAFGRRPVVLWLGNSQVHGVNQYRKGHANAVQYLAPGIRSQGYELLAFSQPNASLQEHYVYFEHLRSRLPVKLLLLPLVFDDTRETVMRKSIRDLLGQLRVSAALAKTTAGREIKRQTSRSAARNDLSGLDNTPQKHVEAALTRWLADHWKLWAARREARGKLLLWLYFLRNTVFRITAQSKRPIRLPAYRANLRALEALLEVARHNGVRVITYVAPIRQDVAIPYVPREYQRFKVQVQRLSQRHGATFLNLERLVPASQWGQKESTSAGKTVELDFMHFQVGGHRLLAKALLPAVRRLLMERSR